MSAELRIQTEPPLVFVEPGAPRPDGALVYPRLLTIGSIRRPLGPGAETANTDVSLDNGDGRLSRLIFAVPPLRAPASVVVDGAEWFAGVVAGFNGDAEIRVSLEAGSPWPLSGKIPLRNTTAWGRYQDVRALPIPYNRARLAPVPYSADGRTWLAADCAIQGVDAITIAGAPSGAWSWRNSLDSTGRPCAFIEFVEPQDADARITVELRGRPHPQTGALLATPAEILHDFLARICGLPIEWSVLDEFRSQTAGMELHGVLQDAALTIRAQIDEIATSAGAVWSAGMPGWARLWPWPDTGEPATATITARDAIEPQSAHGEIYTVLRVLYDYDWSEGKPRRALQLEAPDSIRAYGRIERELNAWWVRSPRAAKELGERVLAEYARPRWRISSVIPLTDVAPGTYAEQTHPRAPITGRALVREAELDRANMITRTVQEHAAGPAPTIVLGQLSEAFEPRIEAIGVQYANGVATLALKDDSGQPLVGARVTLDGAATRQTDAQGRVSFFTSRGKHTITIEAPGYPAITSEVIV